MIPPPLHEAIQHNKTGLLVDFFNSTELAESVCGLLADPQKRAALGKNARAFAKAHYDLQRVCLPQQLAWVKNLAHMTTSH